MPSSPFEGVLECADWCMFVVAATTTAPGKASLGHEGARRLWEGAAAMDSSEDVSSSHILSTAEHRNLGSVLGLVSRLEELRARGLTAPQIAERLRITHPERPGGGEWTPDAVLEMISLIDSNRAAPPMPTQEIPKRVVPTTPPIPEPARAERGPPRRPAPTGQHPRIPDVSVQPATSPPRGGMPSVVDSSVPGRPLRPQRVASPARR